MSEAGRNAIRRSCVRTLVSTCLGIVVAMFTSGSIAMADDGDFSGTTAGLNSSEIHNIVLAASKPVKKKVTSRKPKRRVGDFDHLLTGFSLFGSHLNVECESCHVREIFRGTPRTCEGCHGAPGQRATTTKPINHVFTTQPCDFCHNASVWAGARYDHIAVAPGSCMQCHNGATAEAMPLSGHPVTTESCDSCHAIGGSWLPARFRHIGVAPGTCLTCHGVTATGKPAGHTVTTDSCDACHSTTAWTPATSGHGPGGPAPGTCKNCHNYEPGHFFIKTQPSCDDCHYDDRPWAQRREYNHLAGNHSTGINRDCSNCHLNTDNPNYKFGYTDCAGCHANKWPSDADKHLKFGSTKYLISEVQDCTTSCHTYTDSSLTVIDKDGTHPAGEHNRKGGF